METLKNFKQSKYPFEEYLKDIHAHGYMGSDDDMSDNYETWHSNLDCEELTEHANVFARILLDAIEIKNENN